MSGQNPSPAAVQKLPPHPVVLQEQHEAIVEYICRFRSVDALRGERAELEKREVFFASTKQLNDLAFGDRGWPRMNWRQVTHPKILGKFPLPRRSVRLSASTS